MVRNFAFGAVSVVLLPFLERSAGLSAHAVGHLLTAVLLGDLLITFPLTTRADVWGRRATLVVSALLCVFAGVTFALTTNVLALAVAAIVGVMCVNSRKHKMSQQHTHTYMQNSVRVKRCCF